jgi:peptidoglycan LD-endopeptidase LytH
MISFQRVFRFSLLPACIAIIFFACGPVQKGLGKNSPHQKYSDAITDAGLQRTRLGSLWFAESIKSLNQPLAVSLPYKETGYFAAEKPGAAGFIFSAKQGEKLAITISTVPAGGLLFGELWQPGDADNQPKLLSVADTTTNKIEYEIEEDGRYQLRLQPELLKSFEYTLTIATLASIAFPVRAADNPRVSSFWGADRDGGARLHEGIDIFTKFRTPAIAASDGRITRVQENNLGGKVIFLRPEDKAYSLYYAHLDTQLAQEGQRVKTGDVIGLIGNTGNARTTAPHLHFGIYTNNGAVDPFPFVDNKRATPANVNVPTANLNGSLRSQSVATVYTQPSIKSDALLKTTTGAIFYVVAGTGNWYKVVLPDGRTGFINSSDLTNKPLRNEKLKLVKRLWDEPQAGAAAKTTIQTGEEVTVLGTFNEFNFVRYKELTGWVSR